LLYGSGHLGFPIHTKQIFLGTILIDKFNIETRGNNSAILCYTCLMVIISFHI